MNGPLAIRCTEAAADARCGANLYGEAQEGTTQHLIHAYARADMSPLRHSHQLIKWHQTANWCGWVSSVANLSVDSADRVEGG